MFGLCACGTSNSLSGASSDVSADSTENNQKKIEFQEALSLLEEGRCQEAYLALLALQDYPDAEEILKTDERMILEAKLMPFRTVGTIIRFGEYEQDGDDSNGKEPIEWIILEAKEDHLLLLSRYIIDTHPYHDKKEETTWETCELRAWLNSVFYQDSFSEEERDAILLTEVDNGPNQCPDYINIDSGNNTEDHVFLLSLNESLTYFASDYFRVAEATDYAIQNNVVTGGIRRSEWFLRTVGFEQKNVFTICDTGMPCIVAVYPKGDVEGNRPAMWVDLYAAGFLSAELSEENYFSEYEEWLDSYKNPKNSAIGATVQFGKYEQDTDSANGPEPIEWIVLDIQDEQALLISKYTLDRRQYNQSYTPTWEHSSIRKWLNESFLNIAFDENEQAVILTKKVDNSLAQGGYLANGGNDTEDKVFLLSYLESSRYFPTDESRIAPMTAYALSLRDDETEGWWSRSPYKWHGNDYLLETGDLGVRGFMNAKYKSGIRPEIWVPVDALGL